MRIEAEQFVFPFDAPGQREFVFVPSVVMFDGWGVVAWAAWSAVVARAYAVEVLPRLALRIAAVELRLVLLRVAEKSAYRASLCVDGVLTFRVPS